VVVEKLFVILLVMTLLPEMAPLLLQVALTVDMVD
jgi:hypothetical protein